MGACKILPIFSKHPNIIHLQTVPSAFLSSKLEAALSLCVSTAAAGARLLNEKVSGLFPPSLLFTRLHPSQWCLHPYDPPIGLGESAC